MENIDNAKTILDAGAAAVAPVFSHGGIPFVSVPNDYKVHGLESLLLAPVRKRAKVTTTDTDGFIFYVTKHGQDGFTVIYADIDGEASRFNLQAVLDDYGPTISSTQWREHRCSFSPAQAVEWNRWVGSNKKVFTQSDFATWLEDNLADVAVEASAEKRLRSKINLQDSGVQFEFVEEEDKDTRTKMQVFERFTLGLPVFDGSSSAYPLEVRLKYREKDGKVSFWYELIRPDRVFKTAVKDELTRIKDATGFPVIAGQP